jgi:hypothetical protein
LWHGALYDSYGTLGGDHSISILSAVEKSQLTFQKSLAEQFRPDRSDLFVTYLQKGSCHGAVTPYHQYNGQGIPGSLSDSCHLSFAVAESLPVVETLLADENVCVAKPVQSSYLSPSARFRSIKEMALARGIISGSPEIRHSALMI